MAEFPTLPLFTDAYLGDTHHLTTVEHGAYLLLLMTQWRSKDCRLPDDDKMLARYVKMTASEWAEVRDILAQFFTIKNGFWIQGRLADEREYVENKRKQNIEAGKVSALKRKKRHSTDVTTDVPTEVQQEVNQPLTLSPIPNPLEKELPTEVPKKPEVEKQGRGTRLKAYLAEHGEEEVCKELGEWAMTELRFTPQQVDWEMRKFADYWHSVSGQKGVKLDWPATWRGWCRRAKENYDKEAKRNEIFKRR